MKETDETDRHTAKARTIRKSKETRLADIARQSIEQFASFSNAMTELRAERFEKELRRHAERDARLAEQDNRQAEQDDRRATEDSLRAEESKRFLESITATIQRDSDVAARSQESTMALLRMLIDRSQT